MQIYNRVRAHVIAAFLAASLVSASVTPAFAAEQHRFDVPATEARAAIREFAAQANVQIMVDGGNVEHVKLNPVTGELSTEDGLKVLLANSGLKALYVGERAIALIKEAEETTKAEGERRLRVAQTETSSAESTSAEEGKPRNVETADPSQLQEIIVSAEKSGRSQMDTATSTVILTQADLESRAGLDSAKDVLMNVPNINLVGYGYAPVVRGVDGAGATAGLDAFVGGPRARLNMQIDGRPSTFNEILYGDSALWDAHQVEILRGAQSTLQGRNSLAGTIAIKSNDPTFEQQAAFRIAGGNFNQGRISGMVSGSITDSVAYRLTADQIKRTTWVKGWEDSENVENPRDFEGLILRAKLLLEPQSVPGLRALFTLNHANDTRSQTETVKRPWPDHVGAYGPVAQIYEISSSSAIGDVSYEINPSVSFEGLLSATKFNGERKTIPAYGTGPGKGEAYVIEPRLRYKGEGRRSGVAGIFLFDSNQFDALSFLGGLSFDDRVQTAAIFGETTWPLMARLDLIAGVRYEQEQHRRHGGSENGSVVVALDETYEAFLPKLGLAWHPMDETTLGVQVYRGYNGGGAGAAYDAVRGVISNYQFDPEYVSTYEIFGRQELADGRLQLMANVFYSDYSDMQLTYDLTPENPIDYSYVVDNAEEAQTYGAEFSATWLLPQGFRAYGSLGMLKAEITRFPGSGYQGNELPRSAPLSAGGGLNWENRGWDANLGARYTASYFSAIDNNPYGKVGSYTVVNAQLGYTWRNVRLYGSVINLFDAGDATFIYPGRYDSNGNPVGENRAYDNADLIAPRSFWLGVHWSL